MKDAIELILQTAMKQCLSVGDFLDLKSLIQNPNPIIKNNLQAAFEQLFEDSIFENVNKLPRLTEKGFIRLYGTVENQLEYTKKQIINLAIKQNLNVGSYLDLRSLMQNRNPVIKNNFQTAFEQLFQDGIFENVDNLPKLTEVGFRRIWNQ